MLQYLLMIIPKKILALNTTLVEIFLEILIVFWTKNKKFKIAPNDLKSSHTIEKG